MSKFRNITAEHRVVAYGLFPPAMGGRFVEPDEVITVVDEADESYDCQPTIWGPVDQAPPVKAKATKQADEAPASV